MYVPFQCKTCGNSFLSKPDLYDHIDKCFQESSKNEVKKQESSQNVVKKQEPIQPIRPNILKRRFKVSKPFKCETCSAKFSTNELLQNHTADFHTDTQEIQEIVPIRKVPKTYTKKPFKCGACKAKFSAKDNLNNHMMDIHEASKVNHCQICLTSFLTRIDLRYHSNLVHNNKPIKTKLGTQKGYKKVVYEEKKKPFKCRKCLKAFKSMDRLKGHTALFHEVTKSVGMDDSLQETPEMDDEEMINLSDDDVPKKRSKGI